MTSALKLTLWGEWPGAASAEAVGDYVAIALSSTNSQTATVTGSGTTQTSATPSTGLSGTTYQITADLINFTTVGTTFNTAQMTNQGAAYLTMFNSGANTVLIYPPLGGTINGQAVNIPFGIATQKSTTFISPDGVTWFAAHAG